MTAETYPTDSFGATASLSFGFDSMGRPSTMTDVGSGNEIVTSASYGPANERTCVLLYYWQWGPVTLYQSFTVSVNGGAPYSVPVLFNDVQRTYLTEMFTWNYGGLINWIKGNKNFNVFVNGQNGSQQPKCN